MKKFRVFRHPDNRLVAVKDGFSLLGAFFSFFWLFWHKMWLHGCAALIVGILLYVIFPSPAGYFMGVAYGHNFGMADMLNLGIDLAIGVLGNEWRATSLGYRGFERVATVQASTGEGAIAKYLSGNTDYNF